MDKKFTILYVDDEESNLHILKNTFRREYNVFTASSAKEGLEILNTEQIDLILTDQRMPEMTGIDFLKHTVLRFPDLKRILITGYTDFDALRSAINEVQIFQYIQKPWDVDELRHIIENALAVHRIQLEKEQLVIQLQDKNEQLEIAQKQILNIDKIKSDFLAIICHEMRTPLNGILGFTSLIKEEIGSEKTKEIEKLLRIMDVSVIRLEEFLKNAERITFLSANQYKLKIQVVNINSTINKIVSFLQSKIAEKKIELIIDSDESLFIKADSELFDLTIKETLKNAIKHTPYSGKITIKSYQMDDEVVIEIIDTGDSFSEKVLNNLFKLFIIRDKYHETGSGLNLSLIKLIMDAHHGSVQIKNNEDVGACVRLVFQVNSAKISE